MKLNVTKAAAGCVAGLFFCSAGFAEEHSRRQFDSHEHGVTILSMAVDGNELSIELEGPAMNFVGFEHPPRTDEQKQSIADAIAALEGGNALFTTNRAADCMLTEASAQHLIEAEDEHEEHEDSEHDDDHHDDDHEEHEAEAVHSEFIGQYMYSCESPEKLTSIRVEWFERFPLTTEIEASFLGESVQTFDRLTPDSPTLSIQP